MHNMNAHQDVESRSSLNGFSQGRDEVDGSRMENPSRMMNADGCIGVGLESASQDRLAYLTTCLIGHHVEVQVTNGSVFSGIFHATNADRDFGIVLKMANVTKDVSPGGQGAASDSIGHAPSRTLIIPAHELVQVVAEDVPITSDGQSNERPGGMQQDLMLDSYISESCHVDLEKELQPWMPDEDDPKCPELDNIFDSPWTGSWDQFKVNETLFGIKSTFNEEIYTTKLERGPQTRALEEEASRLAREIEGEETHDLHLAEERGIYPHGILDFDEETKYSSVYRDSLSSWDTQRDGSEKATTSSVVDGELKTSFDELSEEPSRKAAVELTNPHGRLGNSALSTSGTEAASSAPTVPVLSPRSSVGSHSSEKSTLNPNAKEFKLNPNAKSFTPSQSPLRQLSPANDGSFYYPSTMPAVPHMQGMPVGMGVGVSFPGHQPVHFDPHSTAMQLPQAYFPANGPQYGQPMTLGHPRQVMYIPGYPTEMPYKR